MVSCFHCGSEVDIEGKIGRSDVCPRCKSAVKCCRNCRFYERSAHNHCREPAAEWVPDKERSNFCEYFEPGQGRSLGPKSEGVRKKWDSLFKK